MSYKDWLSAIAILLTFIAYYPYIRAIHANVVKPHMFSWIIWGVTTIAVFFAQLEDKGGVGAWPIGLSGVITLYVALLAYFKKGDLTITRLDWIFLISAFAALPLWYFTSDPLWAVIILTIIDVCGFGPTLRKAYRYPFEEQQTFYALFTLRNVIAMIALENYSATTILFPLVISLGCVLLMIVVAYRRKKVINILKIDAKHLSE